MKHKARLKWISRCIRRVNLISGLGKRFSNWQKQYPGQRGPIADRVPLSFAWWMLKTSKTNGLLAGVFSLPPRGPLAFLSLLKLPFPSLSNTCHAGYVCSPSFFSFPAASRRRFSRCRVSLALLSLRKLRRNLRVFLVIAFGELIFIVL